MRIALAAGGRFHAFQLAHQLYTRNVLQKLYTFYYTKNDHSLVPLQYVKNILPCKILDRLVVRLKLARFFNASRLNVINDNLFDYCLKKQIEPNGQLDLFIGWGNYILHSIPTIRKRGATIILESGSCHIETQQELLYKEYQKLGLDYPPLHPYNREKMVEEYAQADYIMTLSSFARQSFIDRGFDPKKILMIPCGMDVDYFFTNLDRKPITNKFRVIFVGMLSIRKGIHYLLDAWHKASLPENQSELVLVGTLHHDLRSIMNKLSVQKNVIFYGPTNRENLKQLYQYSSLFVLPSVEDGFGMVIGEAMSAGLPVICTDHTGAPDFVISGESGFIVPACDSTSLADKIRWAFEHQHELSEIGKNGQKAIAQYTWNAYGHKIFKTYSTLIQKKL